MDRLGDRSLRLMVGMKSKRPDLIREPHDNRGTCGGHGVRKGIGNRNEMIGRLGRGGSEGSLRRERAGRGRDRERNPMKGVRDGGLCFLDFGQLGIWVGRRGRVFGSNGDKWLGSVERRRRRGRGRGRGSGQRRSWRVG